ncbi:transferrin-binding protein-like solute binding protein [Nitratireductor sp. XY-223]|uniref:transferrin-binding protein-like solute binding protein n=1 Tax=Nitratireductor sp. XY-223 TaxID=2561926 RepID=UPI0010AB1297|nr:transferrin-binding protein-like solute binding protein [Nitratireductor sp. XY-223]
MVGIGKARAAAQAAHESAQAEAVKAAGLEVKVSHDDDGKATYRVGDVMIVAAAPKTTMTGDGKTVVTGRLRDFVAVGNTGRAAVAYRAAGGGNAERLAQPAVAARRIGIGSVTDSADDSARLVLVDKYVTPDTDTTAGIYRTDAEPTYNWGFENTITDTTPYGTTTIGQNTYTIRRAQGVFYLATGSNAAPRAKPGGGSPNANAFTVTANAKPVNIYYYDDANGARTWLKREKRYTEENPHQGSGNSGIRYEAVSALENVRFPQARSFEHLNYGVWAGLKEDGDTLAGLGAGFVATLPDGKMTPADDMPATGTATYRGGWAGNVRAAAADGDGAVAAWSNTMTTTADFEDNTLTTTLTGLATLEGDIDGNGFSGTKVSGVGTTGGLTGGDRYTGKFSGNFFGPGAEEIGGVFDIASEDRKGGEARGAFGGRRDGTTE